MESRGMVTVLCINLVLLSRPVRGKGRRAADVNMIMYTPTSLLNRTPHTVDDLARDVTVRIGEPFHDQDRTTNALGLVSRPLVHSYTGPGRIGVSSTL